MSPTPSRLGTFVAAVRGHLSSLKRSLDERPRLVAVDPSFHALFPPRARPRRVATGFTFTEGPVWTSDGLLFTDIPASAIRRLASDGTLHIVRQPSGGANGLTRDRERRLVACEGSARRLTRTEPGGEITVLAERFEGKRLNSPNDVVVASDGAVWFTDPPYAVASADRDLAFCGVFRIPPGGGEPRLVTSDLEHPNGLAFSREERTLYVGDSAPSRREIRAFDVEDGQRVVGNRLFVDMKGVSGGPPDGLRVDAEGRVFATGPGGVWVLTPEGRQLGTIRLPEVASNCAFGGPSGRTLFVTATTSVFAIETVTPGT